MILLVRKIPLPWHEDSGFTINIAFRLLVAYCNRDYFSNGNSHVRGVKLYSLGNILWSFAKFLARLFLRDSTDIPGKWFTFWNGFIREYKEDGIALSDHSKSHLSSSIYDTFHFSYLQTLLITSYLVSLIFTTIPFRRGLANRDADILPFFFSILKFILF